MILAALLGMANAAHAQISLIDPPAGRTGTTALGVSNDGLGVAARTSLNSVPEANRWSLQSGWVPFNNPPGSIYAASSISLNFDGSVAVGYGKIRSSDRQLHAYRWQGPGTLQDLGVPVHQFYRATKAVGCSDDGNVVVGMAATDSQFFLGEPFIWTPSGGFRLLGRVFGSPDCKVIGTSRDGRTIIGDVTSGGVGWIWDDDIGYRTLPYLDPNDRFVEVGGANANCSVIVGNALIRGDGYMTMNGMAYDLGKLDGSRVFFAADVDAIGSIVVGNSYFNEGLGYNLATVWTAATGTLTLADYLRTQGIAFDSDTVFDTCVGISDDGKTLVGDLHIGSFYRSYSIHIPAPAATFSLALLGLAAARRHRYAPGRANRSSPC